MSSASLQLNDQPGLKAVLDNNAKAAYEDKRFSDTKFIVGRNKTVIYGISYLFGMHCSYFKKRLFLDGPPINESNLFENSDSESDSDSDEKADVENGNAHAKVKSREMIELDVSELGFKYIKQLFYRLNPCLTIENAMDVLFAATKYKLPELQDICLSFIKSNLSTNSILVFQTKAMQFGIQSMTSVFQTWIQESLTVETSAEILKSEQFLKAPMDVISLFIQNDAFSVTEQEIWIRCREWCVYQAQHNINGENENWISLMKRLVPHIRFALMPSKFFSQEVYTAGILTQQQSMDILLSFVDHEHELDFNGRQRKHLEYVNIKCNKCIALEEELANEKNKSGEFEGQNRELDNQLTAEKNKSIALEEQLANEKHKCGEFEGKNRELANQLNEEKNKWVECFGPFLPYTLAMTSKYGGPQNTFEALVADDVHQGCGTSSAIGQYIEAQFSGIKTIKRLEIAGPGNQMSGGWGVGYINGHQTFLQYKDSSGEWVDWKKLENFEQNKIVSMNVESIATTAFRVYTKSNIYACLGCLRFYGA